jgi:hypothetical protein
MKNEFSRSINLSVEQLSSNDLILRQIEEGQLKPFTLPRMEHCG